jgi:transcriptional regulator with XRE-family HTH domain
VYAFRHESIRELREKEALTMDAFAQRVGMSKQVVSTWETGACEPRVNSLAKISQEFNVPLDFFFSTSETTVVTAEQ